MQLRANVVRAVLLVTVGTLAFLPGCQGTPDHGSRSTMPPTPSRPQSRDTTLLPGEQATDWRLTDIDLARPGADPYEGHDTSGGNMAVYGDPDLKDPTPGPLLVTAREWGEDEAALGCMTEEPDKTGVRNQAWLWSPARERRRTGPLGRTPPRTSPRSTPESWARPPEEFLSPRENLAAAGRSEPWRWVVGVSADGDRERVSLLHREYGEFDYAERSPGRPGREELIAKRILDYEGQLITIQVHADVAKVVLTTRPDGKKINLPLGASVLPDGSRYCGAWLDRHRRVDFITSYDSEGNEIAVRD